MGDMNLMMATVVQGSAMKPLQNGSLVGHLDVDQASRAMVASTATLPQSAAATTHIFQSSLSNVQTEEQTSSQIDQRPVEDLKCESSVDENISETLVVDSLNNGVKDEGEAEPEVDIVINNVVCSFSVRCHLNLRQIALTGKHVEYRRENGMLTMKLRKPYTTASMWSSGKVTCTGATSEDSCRVAARRFARSLQKLGFNTRFTNYRIVNVLGTCSMPFAIKITAFSERHRDVAEYEPELHPGVTYKLKNPKATLKIFSTGSITVTAPSVQDVQRAIEEIYPLVYEFRKERTKEEQLIADKKKSCKEEITSEMDEDVVDD